MVKTTFQTKTGLLISIEGSVDEVAKFIQNFEVNKPFDEVVQLPKKKNPGKVVLLIHDLKTEGFFDQPKEISEIKTALEEKGRIYPVTSLSGPLLQCVRTRLLGRVKEAGRWKYVTR